MSSHAYVNLQLTATSIAMFDAPKVVSRSCRPLLMGLSPCHLLFNDHRAPDSLHPHVLLRLLPFSSCLSRHHSTGRCLVLLCRPEYASLLLCVCFTPSCAIVVLNLGELSLGSSSARFCLRDEGVQGVLTLFCSGAAQVCHDDRVVELKEQLEVEEEDRGQTGGRGRNRKWRGESRRVRHVHDHGWSVKALRT